MTPKPLVLASSSTYRKKQLTQLGLQFESFSPDIDEQAKPGEPGPELAARLARQKAQAVRERLGQASLIIGSDQVAELDGALLGKAGTQDRARVQLQQCSGRTVLFHTAVTVLDVSGSGTADDRHATVVVPTKVVFRSLSQNQINSYLEREAVLDCAGSFKCEGLGISLFSSIESKDPSALIGLPLIALTDLLKQFGQNIL